MGRFVMDNGDGKGRLAWGEADISGVAAAVSAAGGLDLLNYDGAFLCGVLEKRRQAAGAAAPGDYVAMLTETPGEVASLCGSLLVSHSEFFRNPLSFAVLEKMVLPDFIRKKRMTGGGELRIWSAGCATGQEAWSVAIAMDEIVEALGLPVPFRIFATDLSPADVAFAREGVYGETSVRNVRLGALERCFTKRGRSYAVAPRLRDRVDFSVHDLLDNHSPSPSAAIFGGFDVILCCNVLLYYADKARNGILGRLRRSLAPSGVFVTGEAEREMITKAGGFSCIVPPVPVFQKVSGRN